MQDFTGVPCIVDLATMREAMASLGGDPEKINPLSPAQMVIDHSVIAEKFGTPDALRENTDIEYGRNRERYQFLRWGQKTFDDFKVVPPGTGIVHQVNIEHLAQVVYSRTVGECSRRSPTPVWEPTPTPRWSTGWVSLVGAWVASRPSAPCSASPSACSFPAWWASSCRASSTPA